MQCRLLGLGEHPAEILGKIAQARSDLRVIHSRRTYDADHALHAVADIELCNDDAGIFQFLCHILRSDQNLRRAGRKRCRKIGNDVFIEACQNLLRLFHVVILRLTEQLCLTGHVNLAVGLFQEFHRVVHNHRHQARRAGSAARDLCQKLRRDFVRRQLGEARVENRGQKPQILLRHIQRQADELILHLIVA